MNVKCTLVGAVLLCAISQANAATLTFEDLNPAPASFDAMPAPYSGFTFTGWFYGPDTVYTPASGSIDLFTDYADPLNPSAYVITNNNQVSRATNFVFDGATFSGDSGVTFELYLNGNLVRASASLPDSTTAPYAPTFLASGYAGAVDTVKVSAVQGYYSMDDFTFREVSSVPEPTSYALLLGGLAAMAGIARHRRE